MVGLNSIWILRLSNFALIAVSFLTARPWAALGLNTINSFKWVYSHVPCEHSYATHSIVVVICLVSLGTQLGS